MGTALLLLGALLVGAYYVAVRHGMKKRGGEPQGRPGEDAFRTQLQKHPHLLAARLVRQKDELNSETAVDVLTNRIYQTEDGSYWLFVCATGQPGYVTQLGSERVRNALRSSPDILAAEFPDGA
jgi:hypothetical protein